MLGPLDVLTSGQPLPLGGAKRRAVLASLLLSANEVVARDRLIDHVWGDHPPEGAPNALQVHISQLRKVLGEERVLTKAPGYQLCVDRDELDATRFRRLREEGRFEDALALWRGPPLAEFAGQEFARTDIAILEELRLGCLEEAIEGKLTGGRHAEVVGELEALVAENPLRERLRAQLMLSLYRSGRQAQALEVYRDARKAFVEELGIEPGRELRELHQAILEQDPRLDSVPADEAESDEHRGAFVGRTPELADLLAGLDHAFAHRARLFLLVGEPGIGKSRLAEELIVRARARGARVLVGRCWEAGGAPVYWPWVQSLRVYVREADPGALRAQAGAGAPDLAQILPELRQRLPDLPEARGLESEGARFRLFDATAEFLRKASEERPLLLVLDDLHAADAPSLLLLRFLARELGSARVLLVGAYRDVDPVPGTPLTEMVAEVTREPGTRRLPLGGLSEDEVAQYLELSASAIASAQLAKAVHEDSEGNPLFVGEIARLLSVEGVTAAAAAEGGLEIPQGVRDVISRRLAHLPEGCNRVLVLASVLGREFALAPLGRMAGLADDDLLDALDEGMAARVISDDPGAPGGLRFAHVLIRDTLYDDLTTPRRVALHRRAVDALEVLYGNDPGSHLIELAQHAIAAHAFDKGLVYARAAGDRALAQLAYEEAARLYRTALSALELSAPGEPARCELLLALGDAQARGGDLASARETFADAADLARTINAPEQLARAALGYGGRFVWFRAGNDRRLVPLLEAALERLPADNPSRPKLLARLAGALRDHPAHERRASLTREAVALARRLGDPSTLAYALEGTYAALSWPRDTGAWRTMALELIESAEAVGDTERAMSGHLHAWGALMLRGDVRAADAELAATAALGQELRQPAQMMSLSIARAMRACLLGQFDDAERFVERTHQFGSGGFAAWGGVDDTTFKYVSVFQNWGLRRECGGLEAIAGPLESFVAEYPTFFIFRCMLANVHAQLGNAAEAREQLDRLAADNFAALEVGTEWFFAASLLAEVCAWLDAAEPAEALYKALVPYGGFNVIAHPEFCLGSASRHLGLLAGTMSDWSDAAGHFERALEMNAKMGARPWVAHTQHDYAGMLVRRDRPGDAARAQRLTLDALAIYCELGMQPWVESASALR